MQTSKMRSRTKRAEASSSVIYLLGGLLEANCVPAVYLQIAPTESGQMKRLQAYWESGTDLEPPGSGTGLRCITFSVARSAAKAQSGQPAGCKPPLLGEHSEAFLVLLFQWFWDRFLNL